MKEEHKSPPEETIELSEENTNAIDDTEVPLETATREEIVDFLNDKLDATLTESGGVYISLPGMCKALGLYPPSQVRRIKGTKSLLKGLVRIPVQTKGGRQLVNFLRVDKIGLWLAGIESTRMKDDTAKQRFLKEKIERYQEELAPLATQVFLRVLNENEASPLVSQHVREAFQVEEPHLATTMVQQLSTLSDAVPSIQHALARLLETAGSQTLKLETLLEISSAQKAKLEHLLEVISSQVLNLDQAVDLLSQYFQSQEELEQKLERVDARTKRLSPTHAEQIQNAVGHVVSLIRKKNSSITEGVARRMVYSRLKSQFRPLISYRELDDDRFEEAMEFLRKEYRSILKDDPQQFRLF